MSLLNQALDLSEFQILKLIGHGSFGKFYSVKKAGTNQIYAAKLLKDPISESNINSQQELFLHREINIMSALDHPSIIHYVGFSQKGFPDFRHPTIILEYAPNGTHKDIINKFCKIYLFFRK